MPALQATFSTPGGTSGGEARNERGRVSEPVRTALVARTYIGGIGGKFRMDRRTQSQGEKVGPQKPILRTRSFDAAPRACPVPESGSDSKLRQARGRLWPFERRVRALFDKGLTDAAIARALDVGRATVTYRSMHWRKRKRVKQL